MHAAPDSALDAPVDPASDPAAFLDRAEAFARKAGLELSTLGQKIFKDRRGFDRLREGRMTYRSVRAASAKLDELEAQLDAGKGAAA